jgi:ribonucleoside-diphosphate reductase alpha chain
MSDPFELPLSRTVWEHKYRHLGDRETDADIGACRARVARALAAVEKDSANWEVRFAELLEDFRFLPGGRILAGAGTGRQVTLYNCFVMGTVEDSLDGIFDALKEGALTMQQGGGVGYDFSTLRPSGSAARSHGAVASGPVSFMRIWDSMCATLLSTGDRRGAMMGTLRCDHPDIEDFIEAKRDPLQLRNFNLSVLLTDDFMQALEADSDWPLAFPVAETGTDTAAIVQRRWPGYAAEIPCRVFRRIRARDLWERLLRASFDCAEPGVLFIDRINAANNLGYREQISATNPCGEVPLPPYGACDLGSLNLVHFVRQPYERDAAVDWAGLEAATAVAVRLLDNVVDVSAYPLEAQAVQARGSRRIGLGITGLADTLIMLGLYYDSDAARELAAEIMRCLRDAAYQASIELAQEKGPFPYLDKALYLKSAFVQHLPAGLRDAIARHGIRNSHLLAIAPAGSISLLANNVSNGLEPAYGFEYRRKLRQPDGSFTEYSVTDYAWRHYRQHHPSGPLPEAFVDALSLPPLAHLQMQAALQPFVDNAISKTINIPAGFSYADYSAVYLEAYRLGLKGCTTFRPNPVTGAVLSGPPASAASVHCCTPDREPD